MNPKLREFEKSFEQARPWKFDIGDTVTVSVRIVEEGKTRVQDFEGIVIAKKKRGIMSTFTVRRISYGEGVERVFPLNSPRIADIVVKKKGKTRRAKLYFLKKKVGKKGKLDEKIDKAGPEENAALRVEGA
ncbi:MAG: 50S ribosomal protein L19 [Candidatus Omnitrophica bacterium]|nr:50S ribosomal protein L19 [Candidatus Omnitrophota bacterium]